jgi:RNA polymerase sigma-70 factor (ECF subfamily)
MAGAQRLMTGERLATESTVEELQRDMKQEESFRKLFELHYRQVVYFFKRRGFDSDDSRDLAQDTFLKVHENFESFRGDSKLSTWILTIAVRVASNEIRKRQTEKRRGKIVPIEVADNELSTLPDDRLEELMAKENAHLLDHEIKQLPPQARRCLFLRLHQDLKYREIAIVLQISEGAVKSHLNNARKKLREKLKGYFVGKGG